MKYSNIIVQIIDDKTVAYVWIVYTYPKGQIRSRDDYRSFSPSRIKALFSEIYLVYKGLSSIASLESKMT